MDWSSLLVFPVIVVIIGLLIEYFVIQPIRKANEIPLPADINRDWTIAIRKAVKEFKAQQSGYDNQNVFNKTQSIKVSVDECTVQKGRAILIISLSYRGVAGDNLSSKEAAYPNAVKKYRLEVIRTGEILKSNRIDMEPTPVSVLTSQPKSAGSNVNINKAKASTDAVSKSSDSRFKLERLQELTNYAFSSRGLGMTKANSAQWAEYYYDYFEEHDFEKFKRLVDYAFSSSGLGMTKANAARWAFHNMDKISL